MKFDKREILTLKEIKPDYLKYYSENLKARTRYNITKASYYSLVIKVCGCSDCGARVNQPCHKIGGGKCRPHKPRILESQILISGLKPPKIFKSSTP